MTRGVLPAPLSTIRHIRFPLKCNTLNETIFRKDDDQSSEYLREKEVRIYLFFEFCRGGLCTITLFNEIGQVAISMMLISIQDIAKNFFSIQKYKSTI